MGIAVEAEALIRLAKTITETMKEQEETDINIETKELEDLIAEQKRLKRDLAGWTKYKNDGTPMKLKVSVGAVSFSAGFITKMLR